MALEDALENMDLSESVHTVSKSNSTASVGEPEYKEESDTSTEGSSKSESESESEAPVERQEESDSITSDEEEERTAQPDPSQQPTTNKRKRSNPDRWLSEVKHYQNTTDLLIPKLPFKRLAREVAGDYVDDCRFTKDAIEALQTAVEDKVIELFQLSQRLAIHRGVETIGLVDMQLATTILDKKFD